MATSGIVLAGGQSRRLRINKIHLTLGSGKTLVRRVYDLVSSICDETLVAGGRVISDPLPGARWVADPLPGFGALGGLYAGLRSATYEYSLVVAADMPFLSAPLIRYMLSIPRTYDVLLPSFEGFAEPLHAIYNKRCIEPIEMLISKGNRRILDFYPMAQVRKMGKAECISFDPDLRSFFNINTPSQLAEAWVLEMLGCPSISSARGGNCRDG
jgi:molybdopterin-guanine dinucleotide biosynthesis protein A